MDNNKKTEYVDYLYKFVNGQIDIYMFVEECYKNDICDKIYEYFFEKFSIKYSQDVPEEYFIKFLGAKLYYFLDKLNKRLHIYQPHESYDKYLSWVISDKIINKFTTKFPCPDEKEKEHRISNFSSALSNYVADNKADVPLIDHVYDYVSNGFKDETLVNIDKSDSMIIINIKDPVLDIPGSNRNFKNYSQFLIKERKLSQYDIAEWCGISPTNMSEILSGIKPLSKNMLYKLILVLGLESDEYTQLISFAKMRPEAKINPHIFDIDITDKRDKIIMNFIKNRKKNRPSKKILNMVNGKLKSQDMESLSPKK